MNPQAQPAGRDSFNLKAFLAKTKTFVDVSIYVKGKRNLMLWWKVLRLKASFSIKTKS